MQIIKLSAIDSTNEYLKNLVAEIHPADYTVVVARNQVKGKGQMGTSWHTEAGKNLTFSVLRNFSNFDMSNVFLLNCGVSMAIFKALQELKVPHLSVKWPNDILSGRLKICGILVENIVKGSKLSHSVIGIGVNVNQLSFPNLPNASSLQVILGHKVNKEKLLLAILNSLKHVFMQLENGQGQHIRDAYEQHLFMKDKRIPFSRADGSLCAGYIRGVSEDGRLRMTLDDETTVQFNLKEVKLLY
ncbi:biotin--[acetyl-CoA-carboxylase] ligase [Arenibacter sp. GZD96]|uniref:biotin--[acetyl-CoA-carboxylase] ligase n=1 Tax=Aurantibrevibacter litoralis TaxID=3106030 RepID=UPI002AFEECCF|nr:biotin--[acetyl-CoA-carboxylase] ligase [Arenibacter sp. GZD-96]MEA1786850.1 biotin--[acetyl-CoA-carboxylase] ligase [Arenibacter sp. GZD-96]